MAQSFRLVILCALLLLCSSEHGPTSPRPAPAAAWLRPAPAAAGSEPSSARSSSWYSSAPSTTPLPGVKYPFAIPLEDPPVSLEALSPWEHQENERFRVRRPIRELADISTDRGIMPEALVHSDLRSARAPRSLIIGNNVMQAPATFDVRVGLRTEDSGKSRACC